MNDDDHAYIEWLQNLAAGAKPSEDTLFDDESVFADEDVQLALFLAIRLIESRMPGPLDSEEQRHALQVVMESGDTFPSAMAAAEAAAGVPFAGTAPRFKNGAWFAVDAPGVECPTCDTQFLAFRSPYTTRAGHTYFYWALACPGCRTLIEPAALPPDLRKRVYAASRHRPVKPEV